MKLLADNESLSPLPPHRYRYCLLIAIAITFLSLSLLPSYRYYYYLFIAIIIILSSLSLIILLKDRVIK